MLITVITSSSLQVVVAIAGLGLKKSKTADMLPEVTRMLSEVTCMQLSEVTCMLLSEVTCMLSEVTTRMLLSEVTGML